MTSLIAPADKARADYFSGLVRSYRSNRPLPGPFYASPDVFAIDMERVFGRAWLYAGHACTIPRPGDWFTYQIGSGSIIVVRDQKGGIKAFHNTCRHRGSRVCNSETGHSTSLTCPYHRWTYDLDGRLMMNPKPEFGVDRAELSLQPVPVRNVAGLIFFSLADSPPDFEPAARDIARRLKPHRMERAKLAHQIDYQVPANWKLVFENNRECYHCPPNHPEYNKATYDVLRDAAHANPKAKAELEARIAECNARFRALGLDEGDASSMMTGAFYRCHRTPLMNGFTTQSLDGKPVAPLMGDFKERDAGTLRITIFPNFWQHANDDHAVATRITPIGPAMCHIRVMWFVHKDAVEGKDYTLDRLLPVWRLTSEQDWEICKNQQAGVSSQHFRPGPYSLTKERNVAHFVEWYLHETDGWTPSAQAAE